MKKYCLGDIKWIYTQDGSFVTPFIFNGEKTKIRDLSTNEVHLLNLDRNLTEHEKVRELFSTITSIDVKNLKINTFYNLQSDNMLKLKGFNALKYHAVKNGFFDGVIGRNISDNIEQFFVTDKDIENLTKVIKKSILNIKTKKQKDYENLHNLTTNF